MIITESPSKIIEVHETSGSNDVSRMRRKKKRNHLNKINAIT